MLQAVPWCDQLSHASAKTFTLIQDAFYTCPASIEDACDCYDTIEKLNDLFLGHAVPQCAIPNGQNQPVLLYDELQWMFRNCLPDDSNVEHPQVVPVLEVDVSGSDFEDDQDGSASASISHEGSESPEDAWKDQDDVSDDEDDSLASDDDVDHTTSSSGSSSWSIDIVSASDSSSSNWLASVGSSSSSGSHHLRGSTHSE